MIGVSKLYCGAAAPADALRYNRLSSELPSHLLQFSADKKPVVVWNVTRRCNLGCVHCYSRSTSQGGGDELSADEGRELLDDLAGFGCPVILFSGGEPMMRPDIFELAAHAAALGMRTVISTNGTLIDDGAAARFRELGVSYVGVSLDGIGRVHDEFRGAPGAFDQALNGIRACLGAGVKVGLRFTMSRDNAAELPGVFDLLESEGVPRVCFYHLVYSGRGARLMARDLDHAATRAAVDLIIDRTAGLHARGLEKEVLTVDNHADGPYIYLRMLAENHPRAAECLELLRMNGGNSSGVGIGCVSWDGSVHPDQFWRSCTLGNVRRKRFSEIWTDASEPLMARLKDKKRHVTGRCADCRFLDLCGGNFRVRAEAAVGDIWAPDPACYLTDAEIGIGPRGR